MGTVRDIEVCKKCAYCGKRFVKLSNDWRYKGNYRGQRKYMCSYTCMRRYNQRLADKDRKKIFVARKSAYNSSVFNSLRCEEKEKHTFEEWADIYGVDYYEMWEIQRHNSDMNILDSIFVIQSKTRGVRK